MAKLRSRKGARTSFRENPSTGFTIRAGGITRPPAIQNYSSMQTSEDYDSPSAEGDNKLPGPRVLITPPTSHLVKPGDTLWDIARIHGTTVDDLVAKNQGQQAGYANISDAGRIFPGQRIFISTAVGGNPTSNWAGQGIPATSIATPSSLGIEEPDETSWWENLTESIGDFFTGDKGSIDDRRRRMPSAPTQLDEDDPIVIPDKELWGAYLPEHGPSGPFITEDGVMVDMADPRHPDYINPYPGGGGSPYGDYIDPNTGEAIPITDPRHHEYIPPDPEYRDDDVLDEEKRLDHPVPELIFDDEDKPTGEGGPAGEGGPTGEGGATGGFTSAQDFVDAQKAAGWQWYEDNVWKSGQANPYGEVRDIPPQTYDENLLEGRWDELQNMAFIVREEAALGRDGAMAQYGWGEGVFDVAEQYLRWYGEDFVGPSAGGGDPNPTAGGGGGAGGTGMPLVQGEVGRTSGDAGKLVDEYAWEPDTYGHTARDMGVGYELVGGHAAADSYWIPYVPSTVNAQTVYLATTNALLPFLSATDRYYLGPSLWSYNDQVFTNYQQMMTPVPGSENWDQFYNVDNWKNFGETIKNLASVLNKQPGHDPKQKGAALEPLRWLSTVIDKMQTFLGGGTTYLKAQQFLGYYARATAEAQAKGFGGFDQILQMMVRPEVPGLPGFFESIMKQEGNPMWGG